LRAFSWLYIAVSMALLGWKEMGIKLCSASVDTDGARGGQVGFRPKDINGREVAEKARLDLIEDAL
jgi:hypothetical protein